MAHIKALKQRWLQEYQQEQEGKLRAASSAALEGSTLNNGAATDTASQPEPGAAADPGAGHPSHQGAGESPSGGGPLKEPRQTAAHRNAAKADQAASPRHRPAANGAASEKLDGKASGTGGGPQLGLAGSEDSNRSSSLQNAGAPYKATESRPLKPVKKEEDEGASDAGTPVDVMLGSASKAQHVGEVSLPLCSSREELWAAIRSRFGAHIPSDAEARLVFQDLDGDWLLLQPEIPWELFTGSAKRLLVCNSG